MLLWTLVVSTLFVTMLESQTIHRPTPDVSKSNENFFKELLRDFYQKIIDTKDFNTTYRMNKEY